MFGYMNQLVKAREQMLRQEKLEFVARRKH